MGIQGITNDEAANCQVILIARKGNIPVPLHLVVEYTDGSKETIHHTAAIWKDGKQQTPIACARAKTVKSAVLGLRTTTDDERVGLDVTQHAESAYDFAGASGGVFAGTGHHGLNSTHNRAQGKGTTDEASHSGHQAVQA